MVTSSYLTPARFAATRISLGQYAPIGGPCRADRKKGAHAPTRASLDTVKKD